MAKIITAEELAQIVTKLLTTNEIDDADQFTRFMWDISDVVALHCGGNISGIGKPDDNLGWTTAIHWNDSVPEDGGIWKDYDPDGWEEDCPTL